MWKKLKSSSHFYITLTKDNDYHIFITDYIKIWSVLYSEEQILNCLKESNFGLEIDAMELLEKGTEMLLNPGNLNCVEVSQDDSFLIISMSMSFGYPLYLNIKLKEGSSNLFFQKITKPLLKTVQDLRSSQQELCLLLKAKEEEITDYKSLGVKIRYTTTPEFKEEEHMKKHPAFTNNFKTLEVLNELLESIVHTPEATCLAREPVPTTIKVEPSTDFEENTSAPIAKLKQENVKIENIDSKPIIPKKKQKRLNI